MTRPTLGAFKARLRRAVDLLAVQMARGDRPTINRDELEALEALETLCSNYGLEAEAARVRRWLA